MAWFVVPCLNDLLEQLNELAPARDKSSDGSIGDTSHAARASSHNPDKTGSPEYRDGDSSDEVRARDFDKDLREAGLTMLMVVRHLVEGARSGRFWWLRYVIFQGVIYSRSHNFAARTYTGVNKHDHHAHVNSDFTQRADTVKDVNYHFEEIPVALTAADKSWLSAEIAKQSKAAVEAYFRISDHNGQPYCSAGNAILSHQIPDGTAAAVGGKYPQKPAWEVLRNIGITAANIDAKVNTPPAKP